MYCTLLVDQDFTLLVCKCVHLRNCTASSKLTTIYWKMYHWLFTLCGLTWCFPCSKFYHRHPTSILHHCYPCTATTLRTPQVYSQRNKQSGNINLHYNRFIGMLEIFVTVYLFANGKYGTHKLSQTLTIQSLFRFLPDLNKEGFLLTCEETALFVTLNLCSLQGPLL